MAATWRHRSVYGVLAAVLLALAGCNLAALPYFLIPWKEPQLEARLKKLASDEKNKNIKVVIVASSRLESSQEFLGVEDELSNLLAQHLDKGCKANKENVTVVSPRRVEKYKQDHADWQSADRVEIGKQFEADYVIVLNVGFMNFYKDASKMFYQGNTQIAVSVLDVHKQEEAAKQDFNYQYPSELSGGVVPVGDITLRQFREAFYNHIAEHISWCFTAHPLELDRRSE